MITVEVVQAFKRAWHEADARGREGSRSFAALAAVEQMILDGAPRPECPGCGTLLECPDHGEVSERRRLSAAVVVGGVGYRIEPTSCRCGGSWAWLRERPSGAWEMVGCVCHHLPTGEHVVNPEMPGPGDYALIDRAVAQHVWKALVATVKPVADHLRRAGLVS